MRFLLSLGALAAPLTSVLGADIAMRYEAGPACPPRPASPYEQERIFYDFIDEFYVQNNVTDAFNNYVWADYIQHNPTIGQGRDAALAALSKLPNPNTTIVHIGFVHNTGFLHHYDVAQNSIKFADFYRMEGSCIVEHWDVIAKLTPEEINPTPLGS